MSPFRLGLTGSIGMGKSTTAHMFADKGVPVWDADKAVHRLYSSGGAAVAPVGALCPEAVVSGAVDRPVLTAWLQEDDGNLARLERVVHPLVARDRQEFIGSTEAPIVVLDIPLLYEIGAQDDMDAVAVVSAPAAAQRDRVLQRPGMTEAQLDMVLSRQMPDVEKRRRADYIIPTLTLEGARQAVQTVLRDIRDKLDARDRARHRDNGV